MLFRSRWAALLFVAITIASAAVFVGGQKSESSIKAIAADMRDQNQAKMPFPSEDVEEMAHESELIHGFASDEDLVDQATGDDPTPEDEPARIGAEVAAESEPTIVVHGDQSAAPAF